ncbi:MAG TPA: TlpA disulfide reductase family protein [Bryobacteraceae bacterium]|nr:TlpA disulfide reductase family protein [Bryobacteraceae bacterium]
MPLAFLLYVSLVNNVRTFVAQHDLATAERIARNYQKQAGATPELAAALSWIARGALDLQQLNQADSYASESRALSVQLLRTRKLDADPWLPTALGASIEVHALVLAARGERPEAVSFLSQQLAVYGSASIGERIRKNLNLLNMEGKPAPPLDVNQWLGAKPSALAGLRGHPVLLFFWAHWCPDCKADSPILASVMKTYGPKGLLLIAPTKLYGYVAGGEEAAPVTEKRYIEQVRQQYYPALAGMPIPLGENNFQVYGASTTPTIVLIDPAGVVRYYHPGAVSEQELSARVQKILGK